MNSKIIKYIIFNLLVVFFITAIFVLNTLSYDDLSVDISLIFALLQSEEVIGILLFILSVLTPVLIVIYHAEKHYANKIQSGLYVKLPVISLLATIFFAIILEIFVWLICNGEECMGLAFIPIYAFYYLIGLTIFSLFVAYLIHHAPTSPAISDFLANLPKKLKITAVVLSIIIFTYGALLVADISSCGVFGGIRNVSYHGCFAREALEKNDISICEKSDNPDNCFSGLAISTKDPNLCEKVKESNAVSWCYLKLAEATKNPSVCEKIKLRNDERQANYCLQLLGVQTPCEKLTDNKDRRNCIFDRTEEKAIKAGDYRICNNLNGELKEFIGVPQEGLGVFDENIIGYLIDRCYGSVARQTKNGSICERIQETQSSFGSYLRSECSASIR